MASPLLFKKVSFEDSFDLYEIMSDNVEYQAFKRNQQYWENFCKFAEEHKDTELSWIVKKNSDGKSIAFISFSRTCPMSNSLVRNKQFQWKEGDLVLSLYIKKEFQGLGLGKIILKESSSSLLPSHNRVVFASTYTKNIVANKFFVKEGFTLVASGMIKGSHISLYRKAFPVIILRN